MTSQEEIDELESEIEQKREELEREQKRAGLEEKQAEIEELAQRVEDMSESVGEQMTELRQETKLENDEAYLCDECDRFVEDPDTRFRREAHHEEGLCSSCHRRMQYDAAEQEFLEEFEAPVVNEFTVDRHETEEQRREHRKGIGAIRTDSLVFRTADGQRYEAEEHHRGGHIYLVPADDE
jgi:hypothetical protein